MKETLNLYISIKKIRINIFAPLTVFVLYLNESVESITLILLAVLIHEFGHLLAIKCLGVKFNYIAIEPFGCSICIDEYTDYKKDMIISLSGPLTGALVSIICLILMRFYPSVNLFYFLILNIFYSLINLIPCAELDGGMFVDSYFNLKYDALDAYKKIDLTGKISSFLLLILTIFICVNSGFNFSLTSLCLFILIVFPHKKRKSII